jgi:DNA-binding GntR family transcriptional regulator
MSQANRRSASNEEMQRIVAAIKSGDALAAHQASVDHVRAAAKVALDYLRGEQEGNARVHEIATPVMLKEPRIAR